jgi:hypothetical protein
MGGWRLVVGGGGGGGGGDLIFARGRHVRRYTLFNYRRRPTTRHRVSTFPLRRVKIHGGKVFPRVPISHRERLI